MKVAIEPFLIDNTLMNYCVFALTAAWLGVRVRFLPQIGLSLLGAVYALLSLFLLPILRKPYIKLPLFLIGTLPLYRHAGPWYRTLPFLMVSAATIGGSAMLLTLLFGGSISADGTLIGTVTVRTALLSAFAAVCLPRVMRSMLRIRKKNSLYTRIRVRLKSSAFEMKALIDSGNLLTEPLSGLPVVLINRRVDTTEYSIPFRMISGEGILHGERPQIVLLPEYGNAVIDCICAESPELIAGAQAILPESLLPQEWRKTYDQVDKAYLGSPAAVAERWQTQWLLVHSHKRNASRSARAGRGGKMHRTGAV